MNPSKEKNSAQPLLKVSDLKHSFVEGGKYNQVLRGISFSIFSGELTAVVGPSGCGKSTLLYLLGLLDRPEEGKIFVQGNEVSSLEDEARTILRNQKIGFVFQFHFLIKELSVLENVALPLRKSGKSTAEANELAMQSLTKLGLKDKSERYANKLSGGERQRVAIARAIVNSPSLVLADEPTGNLDSENSDIVYDILYDLAVKENLSLLIVTHNKDLASKCDRVIEMRDGLVINSGLSP